MSPLKLTMLAVFCLSSSASAGSVVAAIKSIRVDESGLGFVEFVSALGGSPGCVTSSYLDSLAFDTNTAGGKAILSAALTAKTTGAIVYAIGNNACPYYGEIEKAVMFTVQ